MEKSDTHYPDYDVLSLKDEWDSHTKEIVEKRLGPFPEPSSLTAYEQQQLRAIISHIVCDNRDDLLDWVLTYFDQRLTTKVGEAQRKPQTPPENILVKDGLKAIDNVANIRYGGTFLGLDTKQQFGIIRDLQLGKLDDIADWAKVPRKDLFTKLAGLAVDAYYSHPLVWSEIGYGGPAYPRGYVRIEQGLTDPWEPKQPNSK